MKLETVKIESEESGFIVINKSDLTDKHKIYKEPKQKKESKQQKEKA